MFSEAGMWGSGEAGKYGSREVLMGGTKNEKFLADQRR